MRTFTLATLSLCVVACSSAPGSITPTDDGGTADVGTESGLMNGQTLTVTGSAFGTKSAPILWDHGQDGAGVMNAGWSGGWPSTSSDPIGNMKNRAAPFQALGSSTINGPHPFTSVFLAGCHHDVDVSNGGNAVMAWRTYATPQAPYYSYWSYYYRHDPNWWFTALPTNVSFKGTVTSGSNVITGVTPPAGLTTGDEGGVYGTGIPNGTSITDVGTDTVTLSANATSSGSVTIDVTYSDRDENTKLWNLNTNQTTPYGVNSWYTNEWGQGKSNTAALTLSTDTIAGVPAIPDHNGHNNYWQSMLNPADPANGWIKVEIIIGFASADTGTFRILENNALVMDYAGPTTYDATTTVEAIGGYARNQGAVGRKTPYVSTGASGTFTQFRYYADSFNDRQTTGLGRIVATNAATYTLGSGVTTEIQPWTSWSDESVTLTFNKGKLASGPVYFWFVDEANGVTTPVLVATKTAS